MAQHKVQYEQGLSIPELLDCYRSPQQCEVVVRAWRSPQGFTWPRCRLAGTRSSAARTGCTSSAAHAATNACLVTGAVFESGKRPRPTWFLAMHLMTQAKNKVSALELERHLGASYPGAWLLKHTIMQVMVERDQWRQLTGKVEIDGAYLRGEVQGGKAGRSSPKEMPFVAAVQTTESGQPIFMCVCQRQFTKESIEAFAKQSMAAPATLVADGLGCFTAVRGMGILHEPHVTGSGAASVKHLSFLAVNKALGNIKAQLSGTYHAVGFRKYSHRYLGQVQYLFDRRCDQSQALDRLAGASSQALPCRLRRVRAPEPAC